MSTLRKASNKGNVNVYIVCKNYLGELTYEKLVATFLNNAWASAFVESMTNTYKDNYNEYYHLEIREI